MKIKAVFFYASSIVSSNVETESLWLPCSFVDRTCRHSFPSPTAMKHKRWFSRKSPALSEAPIDPSALPFVNHILPHAANSFIQNKTIQKLHPLNSIKKRMTKLLPFFQHPNIHANSSSDVHSTIGIGGNAMFSLMENRKLKHSPFHFHPHINQLDRNSLLSSVNNKRQSASTDTDEHRRTSMATINSVSIDPAIRMQDSEQDSTIRAILSNQLYLHPMFRMSYRFVRVLLSLQGPNRVSIVVTEDSFVCLSTTSRKKRFDSRGC